MDAFQSYGIYFHESISSFYSIQGLYILTSVLINYQFYLSQVDVPLDSKSPQAFVKVPSLVKGECLDFQWYLDNVSVTLID